MFLTLSNTLNTLDYADNSWVITNKDVWNTRSYQNAGRCCTVERSPSHTLPFSITEKLTIEIWAVFLCRYFLLLNGSLERQDFCQSASYPTFNQDTWDPCLGYPLPVFHGHFLDWSIYSVSSWMRTNSSEVGCTAGTRKTMSTDHERMGFCKESTSVFSGACWLKWQWLHTALNIGTDIWRESTVKLLRGERKPRRPTFWPILWSLGTKKPANIEV